MELDLFLPGMAWAEHAQDGPGEPPGPPDPPPPPPPGPPDRRLAIRLVLGRGFRNGGRY